MAEITAKMVSDLRVATGLGMMECKKALVEAEGDFAKAEEILRIKSGSKASKMAGRLAAEGIIGSYVEGGVGALVEVNCETDFVAKDPTFIALANAAAKAVAIANPADVEALAAVEVDGQQVEEIRKAAIAKLGENMTIRRFVRYQTEGAISTYLHGAKIGVIVDFTGPEQVGKDVAMHVAASKPICVSKDQVSAETLDQERKIYSAQAAESGKPADIVAKMVEGRINKFLAEVTLLGQPFVKNPDVTVEKLLAEQKASVKAFAMFVVGEGIEKKVVDYAAEVAAAAKL
ncbi:translation elongation factor Ts [Chromobacterium violaceum]|uniref:Elongation factor Ts n=1 Tax=Chromobacterium violaceum (strain ATCC 12472 / DSM 30191 / JCM 1249 / CCUG 213 / NBRC 12614 / NCIMB 9131 / NCTC 9757 / MK) TaxID=243365 RepID=EFTS_CHRVO|nr:translation elongation factor Ts [Chromobacterium violaceum]Q7NVZ3.1 RecName: Full=Elongation factor Ts; Short=EF-Ts [Chromobacterium violaceum ATCC 12472]AAQ59870.1 elongation factor EF-Ts [Chromobacterium violaceum ATCC 12472]KJH66319.1 elongation factor Ts [Chromobacterium violaceum]MBP4045765.1 elongation factor Ts [Chromobacterium violaceum]SUX35408.1 Elongation factor Ts [Chromobacterium violaceum]